MKLRGHLNYLASLVWWQQRGEKVSEPIELLTQVLVLLSRSQSSFSFPISMNLDELPDDFLAISYCFILNGQTHALVEKTY